MSETEPSETRPKKMVSRNVAIALGIICIVLIGSLAYFVVTNNSAQNTAQNTINSLQSQLKDLNDTVWLAKSTDWITNLTVPVYGGGRTDTNNWGLTQSADYAGYLLVETSSTSNDTYLAVWYNHYPNDNPSNIGGYSYDEVQNLTSQQEWNVFPILPTDGVMVQLGVYGFFEIANVTISITYYY
jgi:hypothetical protein